MKLNMATQMLENGNKRQTRMDPAEIGSNADAAALLTAGAAAGTLDGSTGVATPGASAVGEDAGERLTPRNLFLQHDDSN